MRTGNSVQIDMSWMRRYKGLSTAYMLGLPVPGYWNRRWDRKHRKSTPRAE